VTIPTHTTVNDDIKPADAPSREDYGFDVFETEGILELQRDDATARFADDRSAAKACAQLALQGDPFALSCIQKLREDADKNAGAGRNGAVHDYHFYELNAVG
tara:strand:+ start:8797 stop:9105 length:309 start_codon:yes stop_codon:yes gene_type:complete